MCIRDSFDLESARAPLEDAYHAGIRAVAIVFLHGYRYPEHERQSWRSHQYRPKSGPRSGN